MHEGSGAVVGTVCVLDDSAREYTDEQIAGLKALLGEVEKIVGENSSALG